MRATYDHVARRQLGLLTTQQLAELGWTPQAIRHAKKHGRLHEVPARPGVLRTSGAPMTREQAWLAALLAAGPDVYKLSLLTATAYWAFERFPPPTAIDLLAPRGHRTRLEGIHSHETLWLPPSHVRQRGALTVTSPARTLVDSCGIVPFDALKKSANNAMRRRILDPADLARCVDEVPVSGRRHSKPARLLVATFVPGYDPGDSDAEVDVVDILVDAGYPRPQQQIKVKTEGFTYYIDVGYADLLHGFEFQSEEHHLNRHSFHEDPMRVTRLQRAGWKIWPVTSRTARAEILLTASVAFGHLRSPAGLCVTEVPPRNRP